MNKVNGGDEIPAELFQILKDNAALNMSANLENSEVATELKKSVFIPVPKNVQTTRQLCSFSMLVRLC